MGASSQPRKNAFMSQGLAPGLTLRLAFSRREDAEVLVTRVEAVTEERIEVLTPMRRLRATPLPIGSTVHCAYIHQNKRWRFISKVAGYSDDGSVQYLARPGHIDSSERRGAFRLATAIKPSALYRMVIDGESAADEVPELLDATVVDLSEGGLCLSSRERFQRGEKLGLRAELTDVGEFLARMTVTGIDEPPTGSRNRRIHCQFFDISRADRDKVARYLMRRQIEMRRRGQL
jgi:c-di-GMP-binding flagellar brake protein YcgR